MINILYITPNFTIGGTEGQIFNLSANLDKTKFTPSAISIGLDYGQRAQYGDQGIKTSVFGIANFKDIAKFIKQNKIDIVHSFYYGNFSGWELLAAKLTGVKIFITSRRNMGYWRKTRHLIFDIFRNNFTDLIIANSYAVREKSIQDERLSPGKIIVIYNGIDFERYNIPDREKEARLAREEFGISQSDKIIGMISNIKNIKGYEYFLKAAKILKEKNYKVKFIIAGEGSDEKGFRESIKKHGLNNFLISLGLCADIRKIMSVIDIFMYSSLSEGFPNIILEAMASGKTIVATKVGGTPEMVKDGYSGILVSPSDEISLAKAVIRLLENEDVAKKMAETAKKSAKLFFNIKDSTKQYEFVYEKLFRQYCNYKKGRSDEKQFLEK